MKGALEFFEHNRDKVQTVFFDVFDTIFLREVDPEYVKKLWAKKIHMMLGITASPEQIYAIRNRIEAVICAENQNKGFDLEFKYDDFVKQFFSELTNNRIIVNALTYKEFKKICEEAEIDVEVCVQRVDEDFLTFAAFLQKENIPMYCLSDFYLPQRMVLELFERQGIKHFFSDVFVSSEYLLTKRTGRLYDKVLADMNISADSVLMTGDNEHSDYKIPLRKGWNAYLINRDVKRSFYKKHREESVNTLTIEKKLEDMIQKFINETQLPFGQITISLYAFIECLYNKFMQANVKNVFFLSREGEYLKKLFDLYQNIHNLQSINTHYLLVSRKATFLPSLKELSTEKFDTLFRQYRNISIHEFLLSLNFTADEIQQISKELSSDIQVKLNDLPNTSTFSELLACKKFKVLYEKSRQEQYSNFMAYLNSFGVNFKEEGLHLIDVGWKGTIQDHISSIMPNVSVCGHYLGLLDGGVVHNNSYKEGLLFSLLPKKSTFFAAYNENRALFEVILGASHGSASRYINDNKGGIRVVTEEESLEHELYEKVISPMQSQMTKLFTDIADLMKYTHYNYGDFEKFYAKIHAKMVLFPTEQQLCFFEGLYHFENFGLYEFSKFNGPKHISVKEQISNFIMLLKSPRCFFAKGFWGPLTLRNEGLGGLSKLYGIYRYYKIFKEV